MATVNALQVKNLRSLEDTGWIEQKPITVLVGKNSAGKSTFARVFPLLRQSAEVRKQSPILWFGQYVDFGEFSAAVHNKASPARISFGFQLTVAPSELDRLNPYRVRTVRDTDKETPFRLEAEISLVKGQKLGDADTFADQLVLRVLGFVVTVKFAKGAQVESLTVDDMELWKAKTGFYSLVVFDSAFPTFSFYKERREASSVDGDPEEVFLDDHDPFSGVLTNEIRTHVHGNLGDDKIRQIAERLTFADKDYFAGRSLAAAVDLRTWSDYLALIENNSRLFRRLQHAVLCARLPELLKVVNRTLTAHFSAVRYVEPLRATAQRYYRKQDLAVGELDAKGTNVAQFLQSLPQWRRTNFEEISKRLFGFTVKPRVQGGHIELLLEQTGGISVNLADAGVGFSQMLPILLQLWAAEEPASSKNTFLRSNVYSTLVVEQPELHLHPAYQATLADLFCETVAKEGRGRARIVAETHSPALVNRLGSLVANGTIASSDIQILLFEQNAEGGRTTVTTAIFDEDGVLSNWPFGFFEPEL